MDQIFFTEKETKEEYPIDIVVTWVDGNDEEWNREKIRYMNESDPSTVGAENPKERYRNWGLLSYWFRAVEKYAPWVRSVYFITTGGCGAGLRLWKSTALDTKIYE